ncbi:hypothetical protein M409DRAFT_29912 [Zasmidium cellare ATCC 36951]|uniref:MYND-type domain-containing protein n=1 Tax=Zasmidium cellare ATCC 36951 TaxID=1080233 RepID=A0A6A6C190_ZASCE|nr:uncharacterized protein M409DRAFT_29912 [Zasmidium cellare ATCC 36951]KAF2159592.1 hypothetical protein M409DRAFT_29912 [Zasmidium cellare ATCC 36951]
MAATNDFCGTCFGKATQECAGCHSIRYCSRECQKVNWPQHKHLCKTFADFATPPGPNLRRIIILPQDSKNPRFAWLKTFSSDTEEPEEQFLLGFHTEFDAGPDSHETDESPGHELSTFEEVFGPCTTGFAMPVMPGTFKMNGNPITVDRSTQVFFDESQPRHTRKLNQCFLSMLGDNVDILRGNHGQGNMAIYTATDVSKPKFIRDADCFDLSLGHAGLAHYFQHRVGDGRRGNRTARMADNASDDASTTSSGESTYDDPVLSGLFDMERTTLIQGLLSRMKHIFGDELAGKLEQQFKEDQEREELIHKESETELDKKKKECQAKE